MGYDSKLCLCDSFEQKGVWPTAGAQTLIQQLGRQEARGARGVGRRPHLCGCAHGGSGGGFENAKRILPLSAKLVAGAQIRTEEVFEEGHVAALGVFILRLLR